LTIDALAKTKAWRLSAVRESGGVWMEWIDARYLAPADLSAEDPVELLWEVIRALQLGTGLSDWYLELAVRIEGTEPDRRAGIIAQRIIKDDSVGAVEYRVTMAREGGTWHVTGLERRTLCRRGMIGGRCL
jgi:hypothetical protein